jgi:arylsulfatase A-like enzyme
MIACLDDSVGQLRAALERTGQWERTIVIFLSDNGWVKRGNPKIAEAGSNGAFRGGKYELYEGGIRVPCIVRWPGVSRAGAPCRAPSWFPDWFATLTGKPCRDGADLRAVLSSTGPLRERDLCWRFQDSLVKTPLSYAIRRGKWKWLQVGEEKMLFDLSADPGETNNRIRSQPRVAAELEGRLETWKASLGSP